MELFSLGETQPAASPPGDIKSGVGVRTSKQSDYIDLAFDMLGLDDEEQKQMQQQLEVLSKSFPLCLKKLS